MAGIALLKSGMMVSLLAGAAVMPQQTGDQLDKYRTQMANMGANGQPLPPQNGAIAATLAQWRALQQTDAMPFDTYAGFLMAHPGWPQEAANRRAAERQAAAGYISSAGSVAMFFRRYPPQTAAGGVAYAKALLATGSRAEAYEAARAAWRKGSLSPADESTVLTAFPGALSPADQDARMDALLWQGATSVAQRQVLLTSPAKQPIFQARLAFRTRDPNAATVAAANDAAGIADAGYFADKATWLVNTNDWLTARQWLARPHNFTTRPGNVEKFYEVLLANARNAASDGNWQVAYDIARQVDDAYPVGADVSAQSYGERDDYTSLVWLAGQAAMKHLGRPGDAMTLFDRYAKASKMPYTRAKGFYWAGRAAQAAGKAVEGSTFLASAAGYRDQFYGQLANEKLGRPLAAPPAFTPRPVDPTIRASFNAKETVQAAKFLGQIADWQDQTAFVRQIANDAKTDSDHVLANELAVSLNRPDLGVMVGRSALQNGLTDYSAAGFPTVAIPASYQGQWTIIHAISRQESQFDKTAVSRTGARGLMQLMPGTARDTAGKIGLAYSADSLNDPSYNVSLGSTYFQRIYDMYASYPLAIAAYNAGPGNVNKWLAANGDPRTGQVDMIDWIEAIPYSETRNYVQRVLENAVVYDLLNPSHALSRGPDNLTWYLGRARPAWPVATPPVAAVPAAPLQTGIY